MRVSGIALTFVCAIVLVGCNRPSGYEREVTVPTGTSAPAPVMQPPDVDEATSESPVAGVAASSRPRQLMAYSHSLWLVADAANVKSHFERARDRCLNEAALNCILVSGSATAGDVNADQAPAAQLVVSLPHDQVAVFTKGLLAALPGKTADITVQQEGLEAENVTEQATDIDRQIAQLTTYRDHLSAIAERSNVKADDLIQIEEKVSEIQGQLDDLAAQKTSVGERIHRERVTVAFSAKATVVETERPLARAWDDAYETLGISAANVLTTVVAFLPWLPVIVLVWLFVRWLTRLFPWRMRLTRRAGNASETKD